MSTLTKFISTLDDRRGVEIESYLCGQCDIHPFNPDSELTPASVSIFVDSGRWIVETSTHEWAANISDRDYAIDAALTYLHVPQADRPALVEFLEATLPTIKEKAAWILPASNFLNTQLVA